LLEVFDLGDGRRGVIVDINNFRRQIDKVGEKVTELFDGVDAFAAAVIGHENMLDSGEVFRNDKDRTFGIVQGLAQVLIGLVIISFGVETFSADEDQVGEPAFPDEQVFVPFAVVVV